MIVRMIGTDADLEFPETARTAVQRLEEHFPCPEWAVVYQEAEQHVEGEQAEEMADRLVVCRRYEGILLEMAFIGLDEVDEMNAAGGDWAEDLARDLSMTEAEIEQVFAEEGEPE